MVFQQLYPIDSDLMGRSPKQRVNSEWFHRIKKIVHKRQTNVFVYFPRQTVIYVRVTHISIICDCCLQMGNKSCEAKMSSKHANKKVRNFSLSFSSNFVFIAKAWTDDMGKTWESFCACVSLSIWIRAFYVYHTSDIFGYVSSSIYRVDRTGLRPLWNQSCINYLGI